MNITELTAQQLRRAAAIKEQIDSLNKELRRLLDGTTTDGFVAAQKRTVSAAAKKKIAAAQRARWAKLKRART